MTQKTKKKTSLTKLYRSNVRQRQAVLITEVQYDVAVILSRVQVRTYLQLNL